MNTEACSFVDCGRKITNQSRLLCQTHNKQRLRGEPLTQIGAHKPTAIRDELGRKFCNACSLWLCEGAFAKAPTCDGFQSHCRACRKIRYYDAKREEVLASRRLYLFGITPEQYDTLRIAQNDRCAICRCAKSESRSWCVDHDHSCCTGKKSCGKCVRGLLCNNCNAALGMINDRLETLTAMTAYLLSYQMN